MNPAEELAALYQQWRRLTESEGRGIRAANWAEVEQCQSAKLALQPRITEVSRQIDTLVHEQRFRPMLEELMNLERDHREVLQAQRQVAQLQKDELDCADRHLRQLHRSYVPATAPHYAAHWQSWS